MKHTAEQTIVDDIFDFTIFQHRERWPGATDRVFIAEAVDHLSDVIWSSDDLDLNPIRNAIDTTGEPPERIGMLWTMVNFFSRLLVDGALTAFVRPVNGAGITALTSHVWNRDDVALAIAKGVVSLPGRAGTPENHWIFLDRVEFDLLVLIYSPAGAAPEDVFGNLRRRHDRLADIVLANLGTIARSRASMLPTRAGPGPGRPAFGDDPTPEEFNEMFADAKRVLNASHQLALEARAARWIEARFAEDPKRRLRRPAIKTMAKAAFSPYLSDAHFNNAWTQAITAHPGRSERGRPTQDPE